MTRRCNCLVLTINVHVPPFLMEVLIKIKKNHQRLFLYNFSISNVYLFIWLTITVVNVIIIIYTVFAIVFIANISFFRIAKIALIEAVYRLGIKIKKIKSVLYNNYIDVEFPVLTFSEIWVETFLFHLPSVYFMGKEV